MVRVNGSQRLGHSESIGAARDGYLSYAQRGSFNLIEEQLREFHEQSSGFGCITASYDTELFGHKLPMPAITAPVGSFSLIGKDAEREVAEGTELGRQAAEWAAGRGHGAATRRLGSLPAAGRAGCGSWCGATRR